MQWLISKDYHFLQSKTSLVILLLLLATAIQKARSILLTDEEDSQKSSDKNGSKSSGDEGKSSGMILPFEPMTMTFHGVNYYVDMPQVGALSFSFLNAAFFKDKNK